MSKNTKSEDWLIYGNINCISLTFAFSLVECDKLPINIYPISISKIQSGLIFLWELNEPKGLFMAGQF